MVAGPTLNAWEDPPVSSARYTVVIASRRPVTDTSEEHAAFTPLEANVVVVEASDSATLVAGLKEADVVVNRFGRFDAKTISQLERCRAIIQPSTGYDMIDVEAATEHGIVVMNLPFQCIDEVANHALAFVLALNRKLGVAQTRVRNGEWDPTTYLPIGPITGETFGLLGFGNIARATARRAQAFDLNVVAYDPFVDPSIAREMNVELLSLDDLLGRADYVSCHLPLNAQTRHSMNAERFHQMKPTAIFVNTARGPIVDERGIVEALEKGWISAAGLDVLEQEPPDPTNPLLQMDNVIVTPHLAGTSSGTPPRQRRHVIETAVGYLKGEKPPGLLNAAAWERAQAKLASASRG